jgi:hypothetical protein
VPKELRARAAAAAEEPDRAGAAPQGRGDEASLTQADAFGTRDGDQRRALEQKTEGRQQAETAQKAPGSDGGLFDIQERTGELFSIARGTEGLTTAEFGDFATGKPVTFDFVHNTESATGIYGLPKKDAPFGRFDEPSGRYVMIRALPGATSAVSSRWLWIPIRRRPSRSTMKSFTA